MADPLENEVAEFQRSYERKDFDAASRIFINALKKQPAIACRCFAQHGSGQLAEALHNSHRMEDVSLMLDAMFAEHPLINILGPVDPAQTAAIDRQRNENIDKGLPSILLVTQGKSGSITVANIFNSGFGLPSIAYGLTHVRVIDSWARDYARGGVCHTTHLDPGEEQVRRLRRAGIHKVMVHVRDPRQTLVSMVHHLEKYPEQLVKMRGLAKDGDTVGKKAMLVIHYYENTIRWISRWVEMEKHIAVHFSTFESMVSNWDRFLDRYIDCYGGYSRFFSRQDAETRHESLDYHFRSGRADEWREVFSKQEADELSAMLPQHLKDRFDWPD